MKILPYIAIALSLFFTSLISAQGFQGEATYKTSRKMKDLKINDGKNKELKDQVREQLRKQFQKEYILAFNQDESLYKQNETLDTPTPQTSGIEIKIPGNTDILYRNNKENRYAKKAEIFGKLFLIKDTLTTWDWELTKETKNIGEYACFKATRTEKTTMRKIDDDNKMEEVEGTKIITAWYTPQIPIPNGPANYYGLPGLILEVNDESETIICSKIIINPKKGVEINEPTKGKEVTQEKYDAIMDKKSKEMMEQFKSNRKKGDGNTFTIQIGG